MNQHPRDDRHSSVASTIGDAIVLGLQLLVEGAGVLIEGAVTLLFGLLG